MQSIKNLKGAVESLKVYQSFLATASGDARESLIKQIQGQVRITESTHARLLEPNKKGETPYKELADLATSLGIVGKATKARSTSTGDGKTSSNFALLKEQHPTSASVIQSALDVIKGGFAVVMPDGSNDVITVQVAFKRKNAPKRSDATESKPVV